MNGINAYQNLLEESRNIRCQAIQIGERTEQLLANRTIFCSRGCFPEPVNSGMAQTRSGNSQAK